ncbi:MAG: hypothetical protein IJJ26_01830 [Victivallales bacterium]|nr:hypothetical protein [Victivallales bacterium]
MERISRKRCFLAKKTVSVISYICRGNCKTLIPTAFTSRRATSGVPGGTVALHRILLAVHGGSCVLCEEV